MQGRGFDIFLDLKFHDIPNTVARACEAAADLGVWMLNVHTLGGRRMMSVAREALERRPGRAAAADRGDHPDQHGAAILAEVGLAGSPADNVARLAGLAQAAGLDGVVCSPQESRLLSDQLGSGFVLVTPGVRPAGSASDDQQRIMTPADALAAGSHYLVIGRPITQAEDPVAVLEAINRELA
ncbi:orotidine-5'-phosphate decarboxylase [Thiohalobacter thiocyanaticus]|uniref:orotidine-5'-phosphate decarboxylase n=1 Tax=Thiohalobacter thiocyanaticus TaxID=585455 RepID=UPI001F4D4739|nr:orotidine-5'-phosphate decarboxylase [Thiohalobacter thiocyanaticus]